MRYQPLLPIAALTVLVACSQSPAPPPASDAAPAGGAAAPSSGASAQPAPSESVKNSATTEKPAGKSAGTRPAKPTGGTAAGKPLPPPPPPLVVPAGTQLALALDTDLSTKTAKVGDAVSAHLTSDVTVDGRTAIAAGTTVAGAVTTVVSGSEKIGGTPTLGLSFDRLQLPGGKDIPISGELVQKGKSDAARDTAKIVGGAAAGAILGHQVKGGDKGKVIGGLLGGAIGAVAAQKTGTEVKIAAGTQVGITLAGPVEITP